MQTNSEKPEIRMREHTTGPQGMRFELFPIKGVHTQDDVEELKAQLYRDRDVVKITVEWETKKMP